MHQFIENSQLCQKNGIYNQLEKDTRFFLEQYAGGQMILQDDIFGVIKNYISEVNIIKFPIEDAKLCAFVCNYQGELFLYINTHLPLEKQIFAAAHELYHLTYNREQLDNGFHEMLKSVELEGDVEHKANLFAALLLVPTEVLKKQLEVLNIDKEHIEVLDIIRLMDRFGVPYKTMVLRLMEVGWISDKKADEFIQIPDRDEDTGVLYEINKFEIAKRWQQRTNEIQYDQLKALMMENEKDGLIPQKRFKKYKEYLEQDLSLTLKALGEEIE